MGAVLGVLLAILIVILFVWMSFNVLGLILMLLVAGSVGYLADVVVPGRLPWGWLGAILAGLVGSWLGVALIGDVRPSIAGIPIVPAFLGAVILALLVDILARLLAGRVPTSRL